MAKKLPAPKGTKVTKEIDFKLNMVEFAEKGKEAARLCKEIRDLDIQFDGVKQEWKAKIQDREAKRDDLLTVIHAKVERRSAETVMVKNFESKEIEYYHQADGEWTIVERRTMTESELQTEMKLDEKKTKGKKTKDTPKHDPVAAAHANGKDNDVAGVLKEETSRRTKSSAVDGPRT